LRQPWTAETNADANAAFDEAILLDPRFADAYYGRATAQIHAYIRASVSVAENERIGGEALNAARKAIEIAPAFGAPHSVIGFVLESKQDFAGAAAEYEKGLALSPGDARVYLRSARFLAYMGRFDEAVNRGRHAVELDPLDGSTHANLGSIYRWARRYRESLESYNRALELEPARSDIVIGRASR
jgi:tetratricopeptide (TPR) repeat protein